MLPLASHDIVTLLVILYFVPSVPVCVATAFAVAWFPDFDEVQLLIDQDLPGAVVLCEQLVHLEDLPLYEKVALIETDHKIEPDEFL